MANDIKLQEGHPVDENLRPIKVGGKSTAIETAQYGDGCRVNGDLIVTGKIGADIGNSTSSGSLAFNIIRCVDLIATNSVYIIGDTNPLIFGGTDPEIASTNLTIQDSGDITLDASDDIILDAAGNNILLKGSAGSGLDFFLHHSGDWDIKNLTEDKSIYIGVNDGGSDVDVIIINGAEPYIMFSHAGVGFTRKEATFSATIVIGSGGTDDTDIDFRTGNKFRLEMTGDITTINLIFPTVSGNFLLVCTTDGDHDVTDWKVFEADESAATTTDVMWAGGSVPAFTNNGIDIVSFYWDANEQQAYGVASLAFATP